MPLKANSSNCLFLKYAVTVVNLCRTVCTTIKYHSWIFCFKRGDAGLLLIVKHC